MSTVLSRVIVGVEGLVVVKHDDFRPLEVHVTLCGIVEKLGCSPSNDLKTSIRTICCSLPVI